MKSKALAEIERRKKEEVEIQKKAYEETLKKRIFSTLTKEELTDILSLSIKEDAFNKVCVFLTMLSTYTDVDQLNVVFSAPSSAGKSFIALEVAKLFPDVKDFAYCSPTSFYHSEGEQ